MPNPMLELVLHLEECGLNVDPVKKLFCLCPLQPVALGNAGSGCTPFTARSARAQLFEEAVACVFDVGVKTAQWGEDEGNGSDGRGAAGATGSSGQILRLLADLLLGVVDVERI